MKKLSQCLSARTYTSQAKEQLNPAFRLLTEKGIIDEMEWTLGRGQELQIQVRRGRGLNGDTGVASSPLILEPDVFDTVTATHGQMPRPPAERLVEQFHASCVSVR